MSKITATVGISASGKSTYAIREWVKDPTNTVILERDTLRMTLFNYNNSNIYKYYERNDVHLLEEEVSIAQDKLIRVFLERGKHVILSNTNLNRVRDLESLNKYNVPVVIKVMPVTLKEALTRDMGRQRRVGEEVITKQYNKFINLVQDLNKNPVQYKLF